MVTPTVAPPPRCTSAPPAKTSPITQPLSCEDPVNESATHHSSLSSRAKSRDLRFIFVLILTMSIFSSLTNKLAGAVLNTNAGKSVVQKSFAGWVQAFLRGDDMDSVAGDRL